MPSPEPTPQNKYQLKKGKVMFLRGGSTLLNNDSVTDTNYGGDSMANLEKSSQPNLQVQRKYSKRDFYETLRHMNYSSVFALQTPLKILSDKFDF